MRKYVQVLFKLVSLSDQTVLEYLHNVMAKKIDGGWLFDEVTGRNRRLYAAPGIRPPVTARDGGACFYGLDEGDDLEEANREIEPTI